MLTAARQRLLDWTEAESVLDALGRIGLYAAVRTWGALVNCFPVEANLRTARWMGRIWWLAVKRHRNLAIEHLRASFGTQYSERELRQIARRSFEHFAQLYLVELVQVPRYISEWSWVRYCNIDELGPAVRPMLADRGVILLTGHFGNFELLGYTVARLGLPMHAVMRPLDNPLVNRLLERQREHGGLTLLHKKGVTDAAQAVIDRGGALAFIADQDAGRKGLFVEFFGRPASTYKSIGLLAIAKRVPVVVGYAARQGRGFRYKLVAQRVIQPEEWEAQADPLRWITQTYTRALEDAIRLYPDQYLWVHRRWKHQPKVRTAAASDDADAVAAGAVTEGEA